VVECDAVIASENVGHPRGGMIVGRGKTLGPIELYYLYRKAKMLAS
jgi:hypothetical protein